MRDNRLLKVLWGIVLAIFLCSALFIGISYFTGGDSSSKKKDNDTTGVSSSKTKDKNDSKSKSKGKIKILMMEIIHHLQTLLNQKTTSQIILTEL